MKTVHIILNAHLDPIWLWSWQNGLDEVLNTSHYICGLLDRHPDLIYTRGEAWLYQQIRRIDPALFDRIRAHVKAGRWSTVGGWYIQPDCNLPSGFAMERQIAMGQGLFQDYFGAAPTVAYNVDSFGHSATLPGLMRRAGQHSYVMMRPMKQEMTFPARMVRWRGYEDGPEVTVFRIAEAYCTPAGLTADHVRASLEDLPEGVTHTMCFVGIGDHGGGPTEEMIQWCRDHREFEGARLEFSSPERFFAALQPELSKLPLLIGELHMHAIGCYSVYRPVKTMLRNAEHRLRQAEVVMETFPTGEKQDSLLKAWEHVCFHHFHDTLGGTCLPSAYPAVEHQLGYALATADEAAAMALRKHVALLEKDDTQRVVVFNASDSRFHGHVEFEPWLEWTRWNSKWHLMDEQGKPVDYQTIAPESGAENQVRLVVPLKLEAAATKVLRIVALEKDAAPASGVWVRDQAVGTFSGLSVDLGSRTMRSETGTEFRLPVLISCPDDSDTWSHDRVRYDRAEGQSVQWNQAQILDRGPLMASLFQSGVLGQSKVRAEWRVYRDQPWIELLLRILWNEERRVLKLECEAPSEIIEREDGIMGGSLRRALDGREYPLRDWTRMQIQAATGREQIAIVAPDVFALDGDNRGVGLTLLRAVTMAYHIPQPARHPRDTMSDRGEHTFRFRFMFGPEANAPLLDEISCAWQRPPLIAETTRGMRNRFQRESYQATPQKAP